MSQSDDPGPGPTPHGSSGYGSSAHGSNPYSSPPPGDAPQDTPAEGDDEHGRPPYGPYGQPSHPQHPYGQSPYGQPPPGQYGQSPYGQPPPGQYGQSPYGQPAYGESQYGQGGYGQPPYGQPYPGQYGQPAYGSPAPYGQYGYSAVPRRPAHVVVPAVLGFVFAAFGVLATLGVFLGGAALVGMAGALDTGTGDPFGGDLTEDTAAGIGIAIVLLGLVFLAWTVLMLWGSVWALTGRSRVLLLVGGSVAVLVTFVGVLLSIADTSTDFGTASEYAFGIVLTLVFFLAALAIVVPLCLRPATEFFAAHRARRGR